MHQHGHFPNSKADLEREPASGTMWDAPLASTTFVYFDLEMTGLDPDCDAIVEIAWIRERAGTVESRFSSRLHTTIASTPAAGALHGLSVSAPTSAPSFSDIAGQLVEAFHNAIPVAHGADLDALFLQRAFAATHDRQCPAGPILDTLTLARRALAAPRYTLSALTEQLGLPARRWHRAGDDAEGTRALFHHLVDEFSPRDARDLLQVRVGQREQVRVRDHIGEQLARGEATGEQLAIVARSPGRAAQRIDGAVERWMPPHVRIVEPTGAVRMMRADRILRIEPMTWNVA